MKDFGYFGTGDEGYAQYMTAFERNFGTTDADAAAEDSGDSYDDDDNSDEDF